MEKNRKANTNNNEEIRNCSDNNSKQLHAPNEDVFCLCFTIKTLYTNTKQKIQIVHIIYVLYVYV